MVYYKDDIDITSTSRCGPVPVEYHPAEIYKDLTFQHCYKKPVKHKGDNMQRHKTRSPKDLIKMTLCPDSMTVGRGKNGRKMVVSCQRIWIVTIPLLCRL